MPIDFSQVNIVQAVVTNIGTLLIAWLVWRFAIITENHKDSLSNRQAQQKYVREKRFECLQSLSRKAAEFLELLNPLGNGANDLCCDPVPSLIDHNKLVHSTFIELSHEFSANRALLGKEVERVWVKYSYILETLRRIDRKNWGKDHYTIYFKLKSEFSDDLTRAVVASLKSGDLELLPVKDKQNAINEIANIMEAADMASEEHNLRLQRGE